MGDGGFWFTTLSAVRRAEPAWAEIAHYLEPVRRHLKASYPQIPAADRDDLAQDVLVEMRERLVAGYDRRRGRFREYLKTALDRRVVDRWRAWKRRPDLAASGGGRDLDRLEAPPLADSEASAIDLEAELLRAIRGFHDAHATGGAPEDLELVWCFAGRLVHGRGEAEIAAKEGLSRDRVKRNLARARDEILGALAGAILERDGAAADGPTRGRVAGLLREALRRPRERARLLDREPDPRARGAAEDLLLAIEAARRHFASGASADARELLRGLEEVLGA